MIKNGLINFALSHAQQWKNVIKIFGVIQLSHRLSLCLTLGKTVKSYRWPRTGREKTMQAEHNRNDAEVSRCNKVSN